MSERDANLDQRRRRVDGQGGLGHGARADGEGSESVTSEHFEVDGGVLKSRTVGRRSLKERRGAGW